MGHDLVTWLKVTVGNESGWVPYKAGYGVFIPTQPSREAVEALPIAAVDSTPGLPDLVLDTAPTHRAGETCTPGQPVNLLWRVDIRNAGAGSTPSSVDLTITQFSGTTETATLHWTRGLEPGESIHFDDLGPGTTVRLDPGGQIHESNHANNDEQLAPLEVLTCVPA